MDTEKLNDPMTAYCKHVAGNTRALIKDLTLFWYKTFRALGCTAVDALSLARSATQDGVNKIDLTVNFDGPMLS